MAEASIIIALIAFAAFRQWLRHLRREMVHRERLVAIERGGALPALDEPRRSSFNVERFLLLAGLSWVSVGICAYIVLSRLIPDPSLHIPHGLQWIGLAPLGIGLAHLVVYLAGRNKRQ
jgi:hypothetical protein